MKGDLVVAVGAHLFEVVPPGFARIDTELFRRLSGQQIQGAFDVVGGEGSAVVPLHPLAQWQGQLRALLVPRPAGCQVGDDRIRAVLRHILVIHDQVVEYTHHRPVHRVRRFLEKRDTRRTVEMTNGESAALRLGQGRRRRGHSKQKRTRRRESAKIALHSQIPPVHHAGAKPATPPLPARFPSFHAGWSIGKIITYQIRGTGAVSTFDRSAADPTWRKAANCRARRLPCARRWRCC
jgi:hypothetical protein